MWCGKTPASAGFFSNQVHSFPRVEPCLAAGRTPLLGPLVSLQPAGAFLLYCSPCILSLAESSFQGCGRHHPSNPLCLSLLPYSQVLVLPGFTRGNGPASVVTLAGCGPLPSVLQCPVLWASLSWCHLLFCSPCPGGYKPLFFFFYHFKGLDPEEAEVVVISPPSPHVFFIAPFRISSKFLGM